MRAPLVSIAVVVALFTVALHGQMAVRPDDPLGLSLRVPRLRVAHAFDPAEPGTSAALQQSEPWLAYLLGHAMFQREWTRGDRIFDALAARPAAGATNSCGMCHNQPFRSAGAGGNVADPGALGRNVPHLFGAGLIEMMAAQVRRQILRDHDRNGNGFLDVPDETAGRRAIVQAAPGTMIDFGSLDDRNADGRPGLNDLIKITFVDRDGRPLRNARIGSPGVDGYDISVAPMGASISDHQFPTIRAFAVGAMLTVFGLPLRDPTFTTPRPGQTSAFPRWVGESNAGAHQPYFNLGTTTTDCGAVGAGELDMLEWYLLNHPAPAVHRLDAAARRGRTHLRTWGCTSCHVPDWEILPRDPAAGFAGDRRFFDLSVSYNARTARLEGRVRPLVHRERLPDGRTRLVPNRDGFMVRGIYSDLRHHDLGERFYEYTVSNGRTYAMPRFRTAPLWGVGSTAPYGHDGRSLTLDDVIRRHGGDAESSRGRYVRASAVQRRELIAFLRALVLYQTDELPTDVDGDGIVAERLMRSGRALGRERFAPELLLDDPPWYAGPQQMDDGSSYFSYALAKRQDLQGRVKEVPCIASEPQRQ